MRVSSIRPNLRQLMSCSAYILSFNLSYQVEEEEYATRFIHYFSSGLLGLPEGKTLRASLAEKLQCDPMRITKKYGGASCLGNKISKLCNRPRFLPQDVEMARVEIARLERRFHLRMAQGGDVPLPLEAGTDFSVEILSVSNSTSQISANIGQTPAGMHLNTNFSQPSPSNGAGIRQVATPMVISAPSQPTVSIPQATAQSMSSYLATLAGNAQLAAASISPHPAPNIIGVQQQPSSAPAPMIVQQQINTMHNNPTVPQAVTAIPPVNWPMVLQGISQAGVNNTTAG